MISYLHIKNIAIITDLEIYFGEGLNVMSGETGAGKSIVIDSVNFVLGDRADRSLIRYGETTAKVEAVFEKLTNYDEIRQILTEADIECDEEQIIVSRTMTADRSECRINAKIVPLSVLKSIVALLVDTHTQNENQALLKVSNHLKLLDNFSSNLQPKKEEYRKTLSFYKKVCEKINTYPNKEDRERELDVLAYQIGDIEKANLQEGEEENLKTKRSLYYNSQKIVGALKTAHDSLNGSAGFGALQSIEEAVSELKKISSYDESLFPLIDRLEECNTELMDIKDTIYDKLTCDDLDNLNIDAIEKRIEEIRLIGKKYGKTAEEISEFYRRCTERMDMLLNAEKELSKLNDEKNELQIVLQKQADELHSIRLSSSKEFCSSITKNIVELGMKHAIFEIKFEKTADECIDYNENGYDSVEFMLSPNMGEPVKPLAKIASGGEMSRFMLALKNVIAEIDNVDTLIFDEIDTGISGVIARVVAEKLYNIAATRQVIAITHLPQLGSMADNNYLIEKKVVEDKTMTFVKKLEGEEVYKEIMRLSGAVENSETGKNGAKELKEQSNQYKKTILNNR